MKKMLLATASPCLLQDVLNRRLLFKTNRQRVAPKKPSPIISSFLNWAEETVDAVKFVAAQKMLLKQSQQTFVNGLLGFITLGHLCSAGGACIAHNNCMGAHRYGQLYLLFFH